MNNNDRWTTQDEIHFIRGLGIHTEMKQELTPEFRIKKLKQYLKSHATRNFWGIVDKKEAEVEALVLIRMAEKEIEDAKRKNGTENF